MEYKKLIGDTEIASIGLGTWGIGGFMEADFENDVEGINAIRKAIELGYTHIDTAELYGAGHCEELIGKAIKSFERDSLFITSKVYKTNLGYDDVISSAKKSLERLDTSYIDLYMIHAPNSDIDIEETMKALGYLIDVGLIKYIGVSNFNLLELQEAQKYTKNKIVANQLEYNLVTRETSGFKTCTNIASEIIPYCQENDILVMAYRPIERKVLLQSHPVLDMLEKKYSKTKSQIAINWLISQKNIITIPKSVNESHLQENLGARGWSLRREDMELLTNTDFTSLK